MSGRDRKGSEWSIGWLKGVPRREVKGREGRRKGRGRGKFAA